MTGMQVKSFPLPYQLPRHIPGEVNLTAHSSVLRGVMDFNHSLGGWHSGHHLVQQAQMRLDTDCRESRRFGPHSGDDGEKVEIRVGTPGVRIRPSWLRLLSPGRKS